MIVPLQLNLIVLRHRDTERQRIVTGEVEDLEVERTVIVAGINLQQELARIGIRRFFDIVLRATTRPSGSTTNSPLGA